MRQPVLVDVGKLVELTEEVVRGKPLRLVVRLQPLDFCFSGWVDAPKPVVDFAKILVGTGLAELQEMPLTR